MRVLIFSEGINTIYVRSDGSDGATKSLEIGSLALVGPWQWSLASRSTG